MVQVPPFDHLLALELAKYYDSVGEMEAAHARYERCIAKCSTAPLGQETADAMAYSLLRLAQMRKDAQMLRSCHDFITKCGFPDRLNLLSQCVVPSNENEAVRREEKRMEEAVSEREETKENHEDVGDKWAELVRMAVADKQKEEM